MGLIVIEWFKEIKHFQKCHKEKEGHNHCNIFIRQSYILMAEMH